MNPTPMMRGDVLLGHLCRHCGHLHRADMFDDLSPDPDEKYTFEDAARDCCTCDRCGGITEQRAAQYCPTCYEWLFFTEQWRWIGYAVKWGVTNWAVWLAVINHFDYGRYMRALSDELDRGPNDPIERPSDEEEA